MLAHATTRIRWVGAGVGAIVVVAALALAVSHAQAPAVIATANVDTGSAPAPTTALVFVSGAVVHPGLYRLSTDARVADAIAAAGGLASEADLGRLPDLAARVHDGRQVNVPTPRTGSGGLGAGRLNVNTASVDELAAIPGMPDGLAASIVEYRNLWGRIATMAQLRADLGVDSATIKAISASLRAGP